MEKENLFNLVATYDISHLEEIKKAYEFAEKMHAGQFRQSGEPYIIHPLTVAYILAEMHADKDTIIAGLWHDLIEDTKLTKEDIKEISNDEIAELVDGVTKIDKIYFQSKQDQNNANTRKLIISIIKDIRIIIIKLADRLHNMRTLEFKSEAKQKENSRETMEIFAPIAYHLGAYRIKNELEDLSFKYLMPDEYNKVLSTKINLELEVHQMLEEMLTKIEEILKSNNINTNIKIRTKNIYGIYKRLESGRSLEEIHDLLSLKIMVDEVFECYQALGLIHSLYHPLNDKFKDYICNPKTNLYQSLHTTVFGGNNRLVQAQIRTFEMDEIASFGIISYFHIKGKNAKIIMQEDLKEKLPFFKSLKEINYAHENDKDFVELIKNEIFSSNIYVYTPKGDVVELPQGSTPLDFAYKIHTKIGDEYAFALVNGELVSVDYKLKNQDRVKIVTNSLMNLSNKNLENIVKTDRAKRKIKEHIKK